LVTDSPTGGASVTLSTPGKYNLSDYGFSNTLSSLVLSGSGGGSTITLSEAQYNNDTLALSKLVGSYILNITGVTSANLAAIAADSRVASITIIDTAANLGINLDALQASSALISSISVLNPPPEIILYSGANETGQSINFTGSNNYNYHPYFDHGWNDITNSIDLVSGSVVLWENAIPGLVTDSPTGGASVTLSTPGKYNLSDYGFSNTLSSLVLSGSGGGSTITLSEAQYNNDTLALSKLVGSYILNITSATVADLAALAADTHVAAIAISDTAANIKLNLATLENYSSLISSIVVNDGGVIPLTKLDIDQDQLQSYENVLSHITNADLSFNFSTNNLGSNISDSQFYSIANSLWGDGETINYTTALAVGGSSASAISGTASINQLSGLVSFANDDHTLAEEIAAIEKSFVNGGHAAGNFAEWTDNGNTYVLIADGHTGLIDAHGVSSGDTLIKLVGVDSTHVSFSNGNLAYHA
jgi:hypothetical protein